MIGRQAVAGNYGLNQTFIAGEVTYIRTEVIDGKLTACCRIRCRVPSRKYATVSVELRGIKRKAELMSVVCAVGNYVYAQAEHRASKTDGKPYLLLKHVECLRKCTGKKAPDLSIIGALDLVDPIGYIEPIEGKRRRKAARKKAKGKKKGNN